MEFNRFERYRLLVILVGLAIILFVFNLIIVIQFMKHCDAMTQRYLDIGILSSLSLLEIAAGVFFILTVRNCRSITWFKTRIEVIPIILHHYRLLLLLPESLQVSGSRSRLRRLTLLGLKEALLERTQPFLTMCNPSSNLWCRNSC